MAKRDLTGLVFGRLTVTNFSHYESKQRANHWNCLCKCGNSITVKSASLTRKNRPTESCGCLRKERLSQKGAWNKGKKGDANCNSLIYTYKKAAAARNIEFNVDYNVFKKLTKENCHYCKTEPSQIHNKGGTNGHYLYNGLDRIDSSKPYTNENIVTCCKRCNYAKRQMTQDEFKEWISRVFNYYVKGEI